MKIKNIMFGGVMAAILMSVAGAAMAEEGGQAISVASTGYVDAKVGVVDTKVGTIPQDGFTVGSATYSDVATAIKALDTKTAGVVGTGEMKNIQDSIATLTGDESKEGSVKQQINAVKTAQAAVDEAQDLIITANQGAIDTLNANAQTSGSVAYQIAQAVSDEALSKYTTDTELEGKGYQTAGDVEAAINNLKLGETYATVSALEDVKTTAEAAQTAEEVGSAIDTKISGLKLGETYQAKLSEKQMAAVDSGVTADKVAGYDSAVLAVNNETTGLDATNEIAVANQGAIATLNGGADQTGSVANAVKGLADGAVKTNADDIAKLNAGEDQAGSVANTAKTKVESYAVPKPGDNCAYTKCVLSVDQNGAPYWMELALSL